MVPIRGQDVKIEEGPLPLPGSAHRDAGETGGNIADLHEIGHDPAPALEKRIMDDLTRGLGAERVPQWGDLLREVSVMVGTRRFRAQGAFGAGVVGTAGGAAGAGA